MTLTLDESVAVLVEARDHRRRRGRNVYVDEPMWTLPRPDPTAPHPYAPRTYSNGFETYVSDACWCDASRLNAVHGASA